MKTFLNLTFIALLALFVLANNASAEIKPFSIERSQVLSITSKDNAREYHLFIKVPRSYAKEPKKHYPLIFLNDGSYSFPLVSSLTRQLSGSGVIEEPIIVGISYDKKTTWAISRTRDYTPTFSPNEKDYHSKEARKHSGGANQYSKFIESELLPFLHKKFRIKQDQEIYAGHSFGGLFGAYVLKQSPKLFDAYIISDPSLWYHDASILSLKETNLDIEIAALIYSQENSNNKECSKCMAKNASEFSQQLSNKLHNSTIKYAELKGEIHETMFPASMSKALIELLKK